MSSQSNILITLHKAITSLFKSLVNLLLDGFSNHGLIWAHIPLLWTPFINLSFCYSNPLWTSSWTALAVMGSYSTILNTFHTPIIFLFKSLMNWLLDSLSSHGLILHYSEPPAGHSSYEGGVTIYISIHTIKSYILTRTRRGPGPSCKGPGPAARPRALAGVGKDIWFLLHVYMFFYILLHILIDVCPFLGPGPVLDPSPNTTIWKQKCVWNLIWDYSDIPQ